MKAKTNALAFGVDYHERSNVGSTLSMIRQSSVTQADIIILLLAISRKDTTCGMKTTNFLALAVVATLLIVFALNSIFRPTVAVGQPADVSTPQVGRYVYYPTTRPGYGFVLDTVDGQIFQFTAATPMGEWVDMGSAVSHPIPRERAQQ